MAEALLINKTDIAKYTSLDGNIDTNDDIHPIRENYYTNWHI
jgi:Ni2+-binding GTPase involved in maturation of urease and hydrogenase